ncbi:methionyl-tRNA formyltransferase [Candidatus Dependentiae bacterium]|nr:methionyl-tRNA formyltransferase [Candidatus Dependentiae bacterium]
MNFPSIIFFGTPKLSVYTLKELFEKGFNIKAVVTKIDKPCGRNRKPQYPPVKIFALRKKIPVFQPVTLRDVTFQDSIRDLNPDFFVVIAFGKILPGKLLRIPNKDSLNIHFSILPKYRGASPVATAILHGEKETGVSIIQVAKKLDCGDIFFIVKDTISNDENTCDVEDKLIKTGTEALIKVINNYYKFSEVRIKQNDDNASFAPILKKEDGKINWSESAELISRKIRAFNPWPCAQTKFKDRYIKLIKSEVSEKTYSDSEPGTIIDFITKHGFVISCGTGALIIKELQPANKRKMTAVDFINGYRLQLGDKFN